MVSDIAFSTGNEALGMLFDGFSDASKNAQAILDALPCAVALVYADGRFAYVNRCARELYGEMPASLSIDLGNAQRNAEMLIENASGKLYPANLSSMPLRDGQGNIRGAVVIFEDYTEYQRKRLEEALLSTQIITGRKRDEEALRKSEERQVYLLKLSDALRPLSDAQAIQDAAAHLLADHLGTSQSNYTEYLEEYSVVSRERLNDASISVLGSHKLSNFPATVEILYAGRDLIIPDIAVFPPFSNEERTQYLALNIHANVTVPLVKEGKLVATLSVRQTVPRKWTPEEVELIRETAGRTWSAVMWAKAEAALRDSEERLGEELEGTKLLQRISTEMMSGDDDQAIYEKLLDTAMVIMQSDCASIQMLVNGGDSDHELYLPANRGFSDEAADFWKWVGISSTTTCGQALRAGRRTIIPDIEKCGVLQGTEDQRVFLQTGIHSCQTTPLMSRNGRMVGMISTHWRQPHEADERQIRLLDVLARQAADFIERRKTEKALRESEEKARILAEALEKKNRLVTDFFINISHEFKTPLTIMMLGLELLESKAKRMKGGEAFVGNLSAMKQNSYRLNRLVGNLLDITKLDAGFMQPKWEETDIAGLLRGLAQSVEPYARQRKLSLEYSCDAAKIPFLTDSFMLERIMLNLLSNAIKHTPKGGRIRLSCRTSGDGVAIAVADTGEGIPENKKAIIFDRFSQVDTRMTRASEGTGIGLALAKSLVELLGGKITVVSAPGAGSTFTAELPFVKKPVEAGMAEQGKMELDKRVQMEFSDIIET